jgi:hypothetical protein
MTSFLTVVFWILVGVSVVFADAYGWWTEWFLGVCWFITAIAALFLFFGIRGDWGSKGTGLPALLCFLIFGFVAIKGTFFMDYFFWVYAP